MGDDNFDSEFKSLELAKADLQKFQAQLVKTQQDQQEAEVSVSSLREEVQFLEKEIAEAK